MNGDLNDRIPARTSFKENHKPPHAARDGLLIAILAAASLPAVFVLLLLAFRPSMHAVFELTWFPPTYSAFMALTAMSVAVLSFGRYRVLHDARSFWVGTAFSGVSIGLLFYVLAWPGLLPGGRAFIASLPNTAGWISPLSASIPALLLLAAVLLPRPNEQDFTRRRANLWMAAWIGLVTLVFALLVIFERYLPILVREDGTFASPLQAWNSLLILLNAVGVILSTRHYRLTGDRLIGFIAFFQIAMIYSPLLTVLASRRYDLWWYFGRLILVGGCMTVLFGLLAEYMKLLRQVRESESRYRQLTESLPQLIWTTTGDGYCDYLSPQWIAFTGVPAVVQLGLGWLEQIHPEDRQSIQELWGASLASGSRFDTEYRIRRKDGVYRWFKALALPIRSRDGQTTAWFGSCTDIQDLKQSETELQIYAESLERSSRNLQEFVAVASHDLQEPLRKIEVFGDILLEKSGNMTDHQRDLLARMRSSAQRMRSLVNGLLQLSRLEVHAQPFQQVQLQAVVQEVLADLKAQIQHTNAVIEVCELPEITADPLQMRRLFQNLIGNALKFQLPGSQPRVRVCLEQAIRGFVRISVADNGIGFDEAHAAHLFEPFKRLVGPTDYEGSGIGLAICRNIVERHHGSITAHSQPGRGTTFQITLPLRQDPPHPVTVRNHKNGEKSHVVDR